LKFDGTDDYMLTNSIDFTGTDKVTCFAGVRKLSDAARGIVAELSASTGTNNGAFVMDSPSDGTNKLYGFTSKGTLPIGVYSGAIAAPVSSVLTGIGDISGDSAILRIDGTQAASNTSDQGTGNYGNYPLYIGRRGGSTLPFNGRLYSLIVRGAESTESEITNTETWVNQRTRAF
jgi:hypothetical protein